MSFGYLHKSLFLPNLKLKRFYSIIQRERERENERERERENERERERER